MSDLGGRQKPVHQALHWQIELASEQPRTALMTITTPQANLLLYLSQDEARRFQASLKLFLEGSSELGYRELN